MTTATVTAPRISVRMSARDLIDIGIFAAIYIVLVYAITMLGVINPAVMLVSLAASIVAGGVPFLLFLTRVRHAGMITIFAVVTAGLLMLTGHPPVSFALTVLLALAAEAIVLAGRYESRWASVFAYTVYAIWYAGPMLPIFYAREDYFRGASVRQMGPDYAEKMEALLSPGVLAAYCVSTAVFGFLGGLLGLRLLRKHFTRAGLA